MPLCMRTLTDCASLLNSMTESSCIFLRVTTERDFVLQVSTEL